MGKRTRKHDRDLDFDTYDDFEDIYDDDFSLTDLSRDIYSTDWGDYSDTADYTSSRRKIERRMEMKKLHSQLDDWNDFDDQDSWNM